MEIWSIIIIILVAVGIFFICRELNCWYLKINARKELEENMVKNQKEIIRLLRKLNGEPEVMEEKAEPEKKDIAKSSLYIGQKVKTKVEKNGLPHGSIVRIDKIDGQMLNCSQEMREIGSYSIDEIESL